MISGAVCDKTLKDGRIVAVLPLSYGRGRLTVGRGSMFYDDGW